MLFHTFVSTFIRTMYKMNVTPKQTQRLDFANAKSRDLLGKGVQGAKPPAGARGAPAFSPFPKRWGDDTLVQW